MFDIEQAIELFIQNILVYYSRKYNDCSWIWYLPTLEIYENIVH